MYHGRYHKLIPRPGKYLDKFQVQIQKVNLMYLLWALPSQKMRNFSMDSHMA